MASFHLITCEFPPMIGGVSEHSRVLAQVAAARGRDVHVWCPSGGAALAGTHVHDALGSFTNADLDRTDRLLGRFPAPRRLVLQWVPHGYGRRGLNLAFSRWIARRARLGDVLDVIVHEPFVHFVGPSWIQPVRALTQRSMVRNVVRPARRVWISIPGWESRLSSRWLGMTVKPRVLPVPATIPVDANRDAIAKIRATLVGHGHTSIVGYFGAGGPYAEHALALTAAALYRSGNRMAVLCLGRGSEQVASRLQRDLPAQSGHVLATGTLSLAALSHYLQVCDVLLQPYVDGVSGRRTTTVSALEHGVPIATTFGVLSEPYWRETEAVETAPADTPASLDAAVQRLLDPDRNARARASARRLYSERFDPVVAFAPLFAD